MQAGERNHKVIPESQNTTGLDFKRGWALISEQQRYLNHLSEDMKGHLRRVWRGFRMCSTWGLREAYQEQGEPSSLFMRLRWTMIGHELKRRGAL